MGNVLELVAGVGVLIRVEEERLRKNQTLSALSSGSTVPCALAATTSAPAPKLQPGCSPDGSYSRSLHATLPDS